MLSKDFVASHLLEYLDTSSDYLVSLFFDSTQIAFSSLLNFNKILRAYPCLSNGFFFEVRTPFYILELHTDHITVISDGGTLYEFYED